MNIKWLSLLLGALVLNLVFAIPVLAQHSNSHAQQHMQGDQAHMAMLAKHLGATPEQMAQIQAIRHEFFTKLHSEGVGEAQHKQYFEQANQALRKVLNADQIQLIESHGGMGVLLGGPLGDPTALIAKLGLNPTQTQKANQIIAETHAAMKALHEKGNLKPEQMEEKMSQLHNAAMKRFEAILTPDQKARLREMIGDMRDPK